MKNNGKISVYSGSYYMVKVDMDGIMTPHMVRAMSTDHAARIVLSETGILAPISDVEGPLTNAR